MIVLDHAKEKCNKMKNEKWKIDSNLMLCIKFY